MCFFFFFFSSRRRHTRCLSDWSSDVCSSDLKYGLRGRELTSHEATFVPFTAQTRMSGVNFDSREIRKGAADAIQKYLGRSEERRVGKECRSRCSQEREKKKRSDRNGCGDKKK